MSDDVPELLATPASSAVQLLPDCDPWVLGAGTSDVRIVPAEHRAQVSRGASLAVVGGLVCGTWSRDGDEVAVRWFPETGAPPPDAGLARLSRAGDRTRSTRSRPRR